MSLFRILRTAQVVLTRTFYVDETPTDPTGAVAVVITRADGSQVAAGTASAVSGVTGAVSFTVPGGTGGGSITDDLDWLTVAWTGTVGGASVTLYDSVEVVGGYLFGIAEFRNKFRQYADKVRYPFDRLAAERAAAEDDVERLCRQAWVPRFARETLSLAASGILLTSGPRPVSMVRKVRSVTAAGTAWDAGAVAAVKFDAEGAFRHPAFTTGVEYVIEFEHGNDHPPATVADAAMARLRSRLSRPGSGVPERVQSYTTEAGAIYNLASATADTTGDSEVDADLARFRRARRPVTA